MLKANDLRERSEADLRELEKTLTHDVFQNRFKNFTNRLDDTSSIRKAKRDLARVKTVIAQLVAKATGSAVAAEAAEAKPAAPKKAKAASAPKKASAKAADAGEAAPKAKKTSKKSSKSEAK